MRKLVGLMLSILLIFASFTYPAVSRVFADEVIEIGDLTVHFIDVGQGDACIIELPDGKNMLIDAGEDKSSVKTALDNYITANIKDENGEVIKYFDYCIMTHSDSDHIGSMAYVLNKYPAKIGYRPNEEAIESETKAGEEKYVDPASTLQASQSFWGANHGEKSTKTYREAITALYEGNAEFTPYVYVTNPYDSEQNCISAQGVGGYTYSIDFYGPVEPYYSDHNNYSPIMILSYMGRSIALTGDCEKKGEQGFVENIKSGLPRYAVFDEDFCVDVIKLGHHGSKTSSSEDFLLALTTTDGVEGVFVIISCGEGNKYQHPHSETLERVAEMGFSQSKILRTDVVADIVITVDSLENGTAEVKYGDVSGGNAGGSAGGNAGENVPNNVESLSFEQIRTMLTLKVGDTEIDGLYVMIAIIVLFIIIAVIAMHRGKSKGKKKRRKR